MCDIAYLENDPGLSPQALIHLYALIGWNRDGTRTPDRVAQILRESDWHVSARINGELVGFGRLVADGFSGQILDLMTHPNHRRRGIATEIMNRLVAEASQTLVGLHLIDGTGDGGRSYERFGFSKADPRTDRLMYWNPPSGHRDPGKDRVD